MVKRKIEYMNLLHDSLDAGQKLEMYELTVHKWKEALRAVPFSTEPEVFVSIITAIMNAPLPIEYKNEMAQCIHTKTHAIAPPHPEIGASGSLPSSHDQPMVFSRSSTMSFVGQPEFEIHKFFRMKDWLIFEGQYTPYQKLQHLAHLMFALKLKLKEKAMARSVSLVCSIHDNMAKDISVNESLLALKKYKYIMMALDRQDQGKVCKLPRIPDDVDDLKTMCFDTWSRLYQNDPPVPDRFQPEQLVIAYGVSNNIRSRITAYPAAAATPSNGQQLKRKLSNSP